MTLHILKLCVGVSEPQELADWQTLRLKQNKRVFHVTRMVPKRAKDIIGQGSIYWVMKGMIAVRQLITDIETFSDEDGIRRCRLIFDRNLILVRPTPKRPFQGWRYLKAEDAPPDLADTKIDETMPGEMRNDLAELGLI